VHDQRARTPARAANSIRRTTAIDSIRYDGPAGPTTMVGTGRDLLTPATGEPVVVDSARFEIVLEPLGSLVREVRTPTGLDGLVGASVSAGLRRTLRDLAPRAERERVLHRMLDDLPGAFLGGAYAVVQAGVYATPPQDLLMLTDVCRGWADGGSQHDEIARGRIPTPTGPVPNDLTVPDDPLAAHDAGTPDVDFSRRSRRIDVRGGLSGADGRPEIGIDAHFRDAFRPVAGDGMVVHEYSLVARADAATFEVTAVRVEAHALPWRECNSVTDSAEHLVGATLGDLESTVRIRLTGTVGCTHLNDTFRGLDAVPLLAAALA
jgi:hypothetical protein